MEDKTLSKKLQKRCVSFSPEHYGFEELEQEVKEFNATIPGVIKTKIHIRKITKEELKQVTEQIQESEMRMRIASKKEVKEIKKLLKEFGKKKKNLEEELKKLVKKR